MSEVQRNKKKVELGAAAQLLLQLEERAQRVKKNANDLAEYAFNSAAFVDSDALVGQANTLCKTTGEIYLQQIITPAESGDRSSIIKVIGEIAEEVIQDVKEGPLYLAEIDLNYASETVRVGVIAQNRQINNGVWKPKHHRKAGEWVRAFENRHIPVITFIDTPGADAGANANQGNQAHSISALISTMADLKVPTIGVVWGLGYSGGAIPLATTNILLSVRDGIFSTIQPKGLASIARKQKLDWQTCARLVGVSAAELYVEGVIDGVIDYSPLDGFDNSDRVKSAIIQSLQLIEERSREVVGDIASLGDHYTDFSQRLAAEDINGTDNKRLVTFDVRGYPSIFGFAYSVLRSLKLRSRLKTQSVKLEEAGSDVGELPVSPDEQQRRLSDKRFCEWLKRSEKLIYEDNLYKSWSRYQESEQHRGDERGYLASLFLGSPKSNFDKALHELSAEIGFHLYNSWQQEAPHHLQGLIKELETLDKDIDCNIIPNEQLSFIDLIRDRRFKPIAIDNCQQLLRFDALYETIIANLTEIVSELSDTRKVSESLMQSLLEKSGIDDTVSIAAFSGWLMRVRNASNFGAFLRTAEQWKKVQHPRSSEVVLVVASYFFEKLYPEMFEARKDNKNFSGQFVPASIGRRKDFWNRLVQAIQDLRIQSILNDIKPAIRFTPQELIETLFEGFKELDGQITTANPKHFPGFGEAIIRQQVGNSSTSGLITGVSLFEVADKQEPVGLFVSNHEFQAGAFDMSSAERLCRLLAYCGEHSIPVVGFISSGGMQTKEGASALFSMAVVNDQINRFVSELGLPILLFGYGDCTGGAQASLVTHPLVETYYFSGTNMPFAGRIVVPEYLPVTVTLSNYLVNKSNSMQGLVKHPMVDGLDERFKAIDPEIVSAEVSVKDLITRWMTHKDLPGTTEGLKKAAVQKFEPYQRVLVHARGCTAVKLIREAHAMDLNVVLVQSDPDMESVAADMLKEGDRLVCLGGYTPDESYLNGDSVLRIAQLNGAEALHPGIGFLSENSQFAQQCLANGLIFVGPSPDSMEAMGDKSKAIRTCIELDVPVVPGSHGLLRSAEHAKQVAREIGFPIILKAAHGGGGKGIVVVEEAAELEELFHRIKAEARNSFGSGDVYLERLVTRFRHIEVQILRDRIGTTRIIGLRDCSVQRNKQKIIEESISTLLPAEQEKIAKDSAYKLAEACDYHGAGTVEFIYDLDRGSLYFMEMNTRLQVEHPVTEMVSGVDIVREQYRIAMGKTIDEVAIEENGYAIEVRINAERVSASPGELKVIPTPGVVKKCLFPKVDGVTHIVTVDDGKTIPPFYDNLIAQVIVHGDSRDHAISKMLSYLSEVIIEGVDTNIALLNVILQDEVFLSGDYDTGYLVDLVNRESADLSSLAESAQRVESETGELLSITVDGSDELKVLAPSTGILYRSASPDQPVYVEEGDTITVGQTLCLLEAMKMFQPIALANFNSESNETYPSDQQYQVTHVKGVDGQQVNKGDLLFVITPLKVKA